MSEDITQAGNGEGQASAAVNSVEDATPERGTPEKVFTQDELNQHIERRLAEERARMSRKFEKELAEKLGAKEAEVSTLVEKTLAERLAQKELETVRANIIKEFNLTAKQASVLNGTTAEELQAEVEELFGKPRRQAPTIPTGGEPAADTSAGPRIYRRSELRDSAFFAKHRADIMAAMREGRITDD